MMIAQCSRPFSVSRSARMDYCAVKKTLQVRVTSSQAVTTDVAANDKHFNLFLTADEATPIENNVSKHCSKRTWANGKPWTNKNFLSESESIIDMTYRFHPEQLRLHCCYFE